MISPYLFSFDENPPPPSRIGWWWTRARTAAGIDRTWRLHDLRHWSATVAISGGHDVRTVAGRLGHANPAMTLRVYAHAVEAADEAVAVALGQALAVDRELVPGSFVIVGNAEADPAVAEVVAIDDDGVVLVRVLPGPVEQRQHRITHLHQAG